VIINECIIIVKVH